MKGRLAIGLIGAGRLGRVYARDLASRIAETKLVAIADPVEAVAKEVAAEFDVPKHYADPLAMIDDQAVDAIVIVSPTHTHRELVIAAAASKKPTFCEKPPALSLAEVAAMQEAIEEVRACSCRWGSCGGSTPATPRRRSRSRRPHRHAAGVQVDLARSVPAEPGIRQPEEQRRHAARHGHSRFRSGALVHGRGAERVDDRRDDRLSGAGKTVGDIDNAVASLTFANGTLGVVDLSRSGIYGYDISTEILGLEGTLKIGYLRETPVMLMTKNSVAHDTVPYFMERFATPTRCSCRTSRRTCCRSGRRRSRSRMAWRRCASASPRRARTKAVPR